MSLSQSTACHVVPLIARLVLAAAFIPAGWNKLTGTATFGPEQVATLRSLGVNVTPVAESGSTVQRVAWTTAWVDDEPSEALEHGHESNDTDDSAATAIDDDLVVPTLEPSTPVADDARPEPVVVPGETGTAMALHNITLMVHAHGWPMPVVQAWAATAVELLGGALLLVGLFSRIWGLGLAVTMGVAFWLTSWPVLEHTSLFALSIPDYNRLMAQAGLFALAFGIALTGPGALSLDRLLFRPTGAEVEPGGA